MAITIDGVALGVKAIGGLIGGCAMKELAEAGAEMVFQASPKEIFQNPTVRKVTIKAVGVTAGVITSACISKKTDDYKVYAKIIEKVVKEVKQEAEQKKKEQEKPEPDKVEVVA